MWKQTATHFKCSTCKSKSCKACFVSKVNSFIPPRKRQILDIKYDTFVPTVADLAKKFNSK